MTFQKKKKLAQKLQNQKKINDLANQLEETS